MSAFATLARVPLARLSRTPRALVPALGWILVAVVAALVTRASGRPNGADHMLRGTFGSIVVPLLTYAIVSATFAGNGLRPATRGLVALGAARRPAALASIVVAVSASAMASAIVSALVCVLAHGSSDPPLAYDLPATVGVAFAGAATYAAYFSAGSAIARGGYRSIFLIVDFVLGAPAGFGALLVPRGPFLALLGGPPCFDLSRRAASLVLLLLLVGYVALALRLSRRAA